MADNIGIFTCHYCKGKTRSHFRGTCPNCAGSGEWAREPEKIETTHFLSMRQGMVCSASALMPAAYFGWDANRA